MEEVEYQAYSRSCHTTPVAMEMGTRAFGEHPLRWEHRATDSDQIQPLWILLLLFSPVGGDPAVNQSIPGSGCHYFLILRGEICVRQIPLLCA